MQQRYVWRVASVYTSLFLRTAACLISALQQAHLLHHLLVLVQQPQVHSDTQQRLGTADPEHSATAHEK